MRVRSSVTSDGMGGTGGPGETGGTAPLADGSGQVVAGPGSGLGVTGSGIASSLQRWGRRSVRGDRWLSSRPERCDGE